MEHFCYLSGYENYVLWDKNMCKKQFKVLKQTKVHVDRPGILIFKPKLEEKQLS